MENKLDKILIQLINEELNKKQTQVISAFPGVGKSFIFKNNKDKNEIILDSDSSKFSWNKPGERNPDFPNNYIKHIQDNIGKANKIMVSSHKDVRDALVNNKIQFTLVYPDRSLKDEYIERYSKRGNDEKFIELLKKNWDSWIDELEQQTDCDKIVLKTGEYLGDVIK